MAKTNKYKAKEKLHWFEIFSSKAMRIAGSSSAFVTACILIVIWMVTGPLFHYSNVWQLAINTGTTIVTFLMVFLIQKTQNKDALAIQIKLNELVAANIHASNRIVSIEDLSEAELERLNKYYTKLAELTKKEKKQQISHSIEDVEKLKDKKKVINRKIDDMIK